MRNALLLTVLASTISTTGCLYVPPLLSLFPLYTDKDVVADLQLEGKWLDQQTKESWTITKASGTFTFMGVIVNDEGDFIAEPGSMGKNGEPVRVRLLRLGERRFIDLTTAYSATPILTVEGHVFGKIWMTGDVLHVQIVNDGWLTAKAKEAGWRIVRTPDSPLIETPTADLQKLILAHADDPEAFDDPMTLRRTSPAATAPSRVP